MAEKSQGRKSFTSLNAGYVEALYERYRQNPDSVDPASRAIFERWHPDLAEEQPSAVETGLPVEKIIRATRYVHAIRTYGHLEANLYPLGRIPPGDPALHPDTYDLSEADLRRLPPTVVSGPLSKNAQNAFDATEKLREIYTGTTGYDYGHIEDPKERDWLRFSAECGRFRPPDMGIDQRALLDRLTQVEVFEQFLQKFFPGKTRFSIEGLDMLVPVLDEILEGAIQAGICTLMIGMAHRGRLNVLAHVLSKPYSQILAEFKDPRGSQTWQDETGWTGDVTYHKGASRAVPSREDVRIIAWMPPNPSHLEHVNPVIEGMARAAQSGVDQPGAPEHYPEAALPVLVHGDAAFPGEGVVAETLNFSHVPGYETAGTIHIISNNQLGFTTPPEQGRGTLYASDLAKGFKIPVIHVNADDPVACIEAARTAIAYREEFHKDFLIDMIGYRRYGHNEGDEPSFTQPLMYEQVRKQPSVRKQWADRLSREGQIDTAASTEMVNRYMAELQHTMEALNPEHDMDKPPIEEMLPEEISVDTRVPLERLKEWNQALLAKPEGFTLNPKLMRGMQRRVNTMDDPDQKTVDWATAEELAFASILTDGTAIRLTGQDVERGTFSQRHAAFFDFKTGERFIPLQNLPGAKSSFEVRNTPLSESAAIGFEYGYNTFDPSVMALWEAQYGDFINVAQVMVDEFLASGRSKWGQSPSLTLLLPHGYEGQGPDHSSGRPERFLQLASGGNLFIANCTSAAQYFHLLRMQAARLRAAPRPLVVFTPKSLLRNPLVASSPRELAEGGWKPVIDDSGLPGPAEGITRLVLCSGKIAIDLLGSPLRVKSADTAILRLEQLYPFPAWELEQVLLRYPHSGELVWVQEEPENMGAWDFLDTKLRDLAGDRLRIRYVGRPVSASPAEGSFSWYTANQEALVLQALAVQPEAQGEQARG